MKTSAPVLGFVLSLIFSNISFGASFISGTCVSYDGNKTAKLLVDTESHFVALTLTTKFSTAEISVEGLASKITKTSSNFGAEPVKSEIYHLSTANGDGSQNNSIDFNVSFDDGKLKGIYSFNSHDNNDSRVIYQVCNQN